MHNRADGDFFDLLNQQVETLISHTEHLKASAAQRTGQDTLVLAALEELSTALEELQVTEEEVHVQHAQLEETRHELEIQRHRYEDLFESAPDGYIITDLKGVIQQANRAAAGLLGIPQHYIRGKPFRLYLSETGRDQFYTLLQEIIESSQETHMRDIQLHPRGNQLLDVGLTVTVIRDPKGNPVEIRWLLRDITPQKEIERAIRTLNTSLEERVRERTALLEQEKHLREQALQRERAARLEAEILRDTGNILNSTLDLPQVLNHILDNLGRVVPHQAADVMLVDREEVFIAHCRGYEGCGREEILSKMRFPIATTFPLMEVVNTGKPVIIPSLEAPTEWIEAIGIQTPVKSFVSVPIQAAARSSASLI
jgi:PAS domain S-box-containing protein